MHHKQRQISRVSSAVTKRHAAKSSGTDGVADSVQACVHVALVEDFERGDVDRVPPPWAPASSADTKGETAAATTATSQASRTRIDQHRPPCDMSSGDAASVPSRARCGPLRAAIRAHTVVPVTGASCPERGGVARLVGAAGSTHTACTACVTQSPSNGPQIYPNN